HEPVRRHPLRPDGGPHRRPRRGAERERRRALRDLRAGPRQRSRHRRSGHREPHGHDAHRRDDARSPRLPGGGLPHRGCRRPRPRRGPGHPRPRGRRDHRAVHRCGDSGVHFGLMYALAQAMRAIRANWVASVSTITTMTLSLTMLAALSLTSANLSQVLANLQGELEVAVYLAPEANDEQLIATVRAWQEVERVEYVRSDQALAELVADLPALSRAASFVENPLPDTLHVRLFDPQETQAVRFRLEQLPGVDEVDAASEAVDTFLAVYDALRVGGSILVVVLLSAALFAIVNSIRAAITARRDEIDVMRLVGASRGFIRAPFLIEGVLLGLIS